MIRAGAAMVDITPKAGTHLAGSGCGEHRPAQSVIDPLYAKAVVFESEGGRICILALDVTIVTGDYTTRIRQVASERFGFDPDAVMVHATQTHSAPSCGQFMLDPDFPLELAPEQEHVRGCESSYADLAAERAVEAIETAVKRLQPVQIGAGSGVRDRLAFNRRAVMRDGSVTMPGPAARPDAPLGPTSIRCLEGPTDPEVGVLCARTEDMEVVAMLLHFTCHPVNVFGDRSSYYAVSADWPGAWAAGMQAAFGQECVPLVVNGCCGNLNPWDPFDTESTTRCDNARDMGEALTERGRQVARSMTFTEHTKIDWRVRRVPLAYRDVPAERQAEVEKILSEHPQPKWRDDGQIDTDWFLAASTRSIDCCRKRSPEFAYEIQAFRIGDVALVGLPGEPFVEGQLAVKIGSPTCPTYVAHCTSHYVGYVPTEEAYSRGGHEANADCTYWAKLAPGSLETVVENALELLGELFA